MSGGLKQYAHYPSLKNRVIVISGGATGIGESLTRAFTLQESQVIVLDILPSSEFKLADELQSLNPTHLPIYYQCNVTRTEHDLQPIVTKILSQFPKVNGLINNAANDRRQPTLEVTERDWDDSVAVNLRHQFFLTQKLLPGLLAAAPASSVINMGSISWAIPATGLVPYSTSKAAIVGLTKTLAHEFGPKGIRFNSIMPGAIATERQKRMILTPEYERWVLDHQALKHILEPDDVARLALWLIADDKHFERFSPKPPTLSYSTFIAQDSPITALSNRIRSLPSEDDISPAPLQPSEPEASSSSPPSPKPPPFSSLYFPTQAEVDRFKVAVTEAVTNSLLATAPAPSFAEALAEDEAEQRAAETKAALPRDTKGESSNRGLDDGEPPPPYTEGSSPLDSFTYVMAAAGGPSSIITQVQQTPGPPINTLGGDVGADEHITLDLRGTRFSLSRDELLTLPEFVLLSLFPNGLLPDGHMNTFHDGDVYPVDYDPASLQYMLDFFRGVAQSIPSSSPSPSASHENDPVSIEPLAGSAKDMLQDRAGIIVLREDLDFYVIPPKQDIEQTEMMEVKRAAARALLKQDGIFSGLRRSEEVGTTEQHLIEMLTAGGFDHDDRWGHRAGEPNKAVICSLALARLRTDIKGDMTGNNAVGMAQKLLLFWRKPARRCWWEGVELSNVDGVSGKLKVWIRRVWTLEMSVIGLR